MTDPEPDEHLEAEFDDRESKAEANDEDGPDPFGDALLAGEDDADGEEIDPAFAAWLAKLEETADEQRFAQFDQFDEDWRR